MRCPQCGNDCAQGAQFCSRCGTRLFAPKPAAVHEYMLLKVRCSMWCFQGALIISAILIIVGFVTLFMPLLNSATPQLNNNANLIVGYVLIGLGVLNICRIWIDRRFRSWTVTSDRIIEQNGMLSRSRREMELSDIRSAEVNQRFMQRMLGIGDVTIASAASADFAIRMVCVAGPGEVAETVRRARLKRLA